MFNALLVLLPFALLVIFGLSQENSLNNSWEAMKASFGNIPPAGLIAVGLATVLWNYSAWDNVSTFAGEVNEAEKNYPRALMSTLPLTICAYLLPVFIGIGITADESIWNESAGFPALATIISGEWLGLLIAIAALLSAWSLFNSQLLYVSRMPFVMARDGWLPSILTKTSETTGVPINALLLSCGISLIFCALPFGKLVVIDILLYSAALVLEFIALLVLRKREPEMNRPFKIKGGWTVLILLTLAPTAFASIVLFATLSDPEIDYRQVLAVVLAMVSGVVLYFLRRGKIDQESQA
jgi:amino acid transporter